jgi:hypothetical protein
VPLEMNEYFDFLAKYDLKNDPQMPQPLCP